MSFIKVFLAASLCTIVLTLAAGSLALAEPPKDAKTAAAPAVQLPPGWTEADMQACMIAGTPGKMHETLAKGVGTWQGKNTMWMYPGAAPVVTQCSSTVTPIMGGRFIKCDMIGEMPGMGPFNGFGLFGFDNVTQKLVSTWIDNCGTGILTGTGQLSPDGKSITWSYTYTCPITKKPASMRQVETVTSDSTRTLEVYTNDPKSGQEFKMLTIEFAKK